MCTSYVPEQPTIVAVNFVHCPQIVSRLLQVRIVATSHMQTGEKQLGNDTDAINVHTCRLFITVPIDTHIVSYPHTQTTCFPFTCELDIQD